MLKKVAKALDEMAKNEELMEGILQAAVGGMDDDPNMLMEDGNRMMGGGGEIEQPEGERLGTIGEDGDEDRHIYDTNTHGGLARDISGAAAFNKPDPDDEDDYEEYEDDNKQHRAVHDAGQPAGADDDYEF